MLSSDLCTSARNYCMITVSLLLLAMGLNSRNLWPFFSTLFQFVFSVLREESERGVPAGASAEVRAQVEEAGARLNQVKKNITKNVAKNQ